MGPSVTPVVLGENDNHAIEIRLQWPGSVSGEVYDENRVGLSECPVYVFRLDKRIRVVASGETDDRGRYRIRAATRPIPDRHLRAGVAWQSQLLPTFSGQTASATAARSVEARLEEETADVSIEPLAGQLGALRVIAPGATSVGRSPTSAAPRANSRPPVPTSSAALHPARTSCSPRALPATYRWRPGNGLRSAAKRAVLLCNWDPRRYR